jgi:hypothetical protein
MFEVRGRADQGADDCSNAAKRLLCRSIQRRRRAEQVGKYVSESDDVASCEMARLLVKPILQV